MNSQPATSTPEAIDELQNRCNRSPGDIPSRIALAQALLAANRAAEAVIPAEQAAALAPTLPAALQIRAAVLGALEAGDPELVKLELMAALNPTNAEAQLALGEAYAALDRPHDAERHFKATLALGRLCEAHARLAALYLSVEMHEATEHHALAALKAGEETGADDALIVMAHQALAAVFEARGDAATSAAHLDRAYTRQSLFRQPVANAPFTTLVLVTRETGNVPYKTLMPPLRFDCAVWYMEHARLEQMADLPSYAVVLNAIGDPDVAQASSAVVDAFVAQCDRPVLNAPERVRATFRHRLKETLAGVEDVVVPDTIRLTAENIAAHGLSACITKAGFSGALILRPTGSHGGVGVSLAQHPSDFTAFPFPAGHDAYVSQFHDYRSADGFYRKYRVIFVADQAFPYHLAIGRHWMVHHQSTDMADDEGRIREELSFLSDPAAALGARVMGAIQAIGQGLGLDYGGVDFSLTPDGRVLVFEANATMLTHLEPADGPFAAKNPFIQPIIDAFQSRLMKLAGSN